MSFLVSHVNHKSCHQTSSPLHDTGKFSLPGRFCNVKSSSCHTSMICRVSLLCITKLCWGWKPSHTHRTAGSLLQLVSLVHGEAWALPEAFPTLPTRTGFRLSVATWWWWGCWALHEAFATLTTFCGLVWILWCTFWVVHVRFSHCQGNDVASPSCGAWWGMSQN